MDGTIKAISERDTLVAQAIAKGDAGKHKPNSRMFQRAASLM